MLKGRVEIVDIRIYVNVIKRKHSFSCQVSINKKQEKNADTTYMYMHASNNNDRQRTSSIHVFG